MMSTENHTAVPGPSQQSEDPLRKLPFNPETVIKSPQQTSEHRPAAVGSEIPFSGLDVQSVATHSRGFEPVRPAGSVDYLTPTLYQPARESSPPKQVPTFSVPALLNQVEQSSGFLPPAGSLAFSHTWPSPGAFHQEGHQLPQVKSLMMPSAPLYFNRSSPILWQHNFPPSSGALPSVSRLASPQQIAGPSWNSANSSYLYDPSGTLSPEGYDSWAGLPFASVNSPGSPSSGQSRSTSRSSLDLYRPYSEHLDSSSGETSVIRSLQPKVETLTQPRFRESAPPTSLSPSSVIVTQKPKKRHPSTMMTDVAKSAEDSDANDGKSGKKPPPPKKKGSGNLIDQSASTIYVPATRPVPPETKSPPKKTRVKREEGVVEEDVSSSAESELKTEPKKKRKKYVKPVSRTPPPAPVLSPTYGLRNKIPAGIVFSEGERLEACDATKTWYKARIVTVNKEAGQIYVHFEGWNARYDEWLPMASRRIRPLTEEKFSEHQERYNIGDYLIARWSSATSKPGIVVEVQTDPEKYVILYHDGAKRLVTNKGLRRMSPVLRERFANELKQLVEVASTYPLLQDSPSDLEASPLYLHESAANCEQQSASGASASGLQQNPGLLSSQLAASTSRTPQLHPAMVESQLLITSKSKPKRQPKKPWKLEDHVEIVRKKRKTKADLNTTAEPVVAVEDIVNTQDIPTEKEPSHTVLRQNAIKAISPLSFAHDVHLHPPDHPHDHRSTLESLLESPLFRMSPPDKPSDSPDLESAMDSVSYEDGTSSSSMSNLTLLPQRSVQISTNIPLSIVSHSAGTPSPVLKSMLKSPERHLATESHSSSHLGYTGPAPVLPPEVAAPKKDNKQRKRPTKPPAPKELIVCVDHNEFKCTVTECHKSFRKQKLLHDHLRHYHNFSVEEVEEPVAKTAAAKGKKRTLSVEESIATPPLKVAGTPSIISPPQGGLDYFLPMAEVGPLSSTTALYNEFSPDNFPAALPELPSVGQQGFFGQSLTGRLPPTPGGFPRTLPFDYQDKMKKDNKQPKRDSLAGASEVPRVDDKKKTTFKKKKPPKEAVVEVPTPPPVIEPPVVEEEPVKPKKRNHHKPRAKRVEEYETDEEEITQYIQNDHELVHCKCNYELENGFMVQCELCATWQHGSCYEMEEKSDVPLHYVCDFCRTPKAVRSSQRNICHDLPYIRSGRLSVFFPLEEDVEESTSSTMFPALPSPSGFYQNVNRPLYRDLAADTIACNDQLKALKRVSRALVAAGECETKSAALLTGICKTQSERVKLSNLLNSLPEDVVKSQDLTENLRKLSLLTTLMPDGEKASVFETVAQPDENHTIKESELPKLELPLVNGFSHTSDPDSPLPSADLVSAPYSPTSLPNGNVSVVISPASPVPDLRPSSPEPFEPFTPTEEEVAGGVVKGVLDSIVDNFLPENSPFPVTEHIPAAYASSLPGAPLSTDRVDSPEIGAIGVATMTNPPTPPEETKESNDLPPDDSPKIEETSSVPLLQDLDPDIMTMCLQGDIAAVLIAVNNRDEVLAKYLDEIESRIFEMEKQCDAKYGTKYASTPELAQKDWDELQEKLCRQQSDLRNLERLGHVVAVEPRNKTVRQMPGPLPIPSTVDFGGSSGNQQSEVGRPSLSLKIRLNGKPKRTPSKRPTKLATKDDSKGSPAPSVVVGDQVSAVVTIN